MKLLFTFLQNKLP